MDSILCAKSELCIFEPTTMQVVMENSLWCDIHPTSSIDKSNVIEFLISGSTTDYLDLNDTILSLTCRVRDNQNNAPDATTYANIQVVNYLMHALFTDVKVFLNDVQIEGGGNLYPYKSVIQNELNFSGDTKNVQLTTAGYADKDSTKLKDYCKDGLTFQLIGSLNIDFFQTQSKYIIPGVDVKLLLERSKHNFTMQIPANAVVAQVKPQISIMDAVIYVRKVQCAQPVLIGHELGLEKQNAIYPYQKTECITYNISQGAHSFIQENLFRGNVPKFAIVALVQNAAMNGAYKLNPFAFTHYDLNFISLFCDGHAIPYRTGYKPDFEGKQFAREYFMSIVQNMEHMRKNVNCGISLDEWANDGKTYFTFNLTPDFCMNQAQPPR